MHVYKCKKESFFVSSLIYEKINFDKIDLTLILLN